MKKIIALTAITLALLSCAPAHHLRVEALATTPVDEKSLYTLIYILGANNDDPKFAIFLDKENDEYEFKPSVDELNYEILQKITLHEAFLEADLFFSSKKIRNFVSSAVYGPDNSVAGYEFRPLLNLNRKGPMDVINLKYTIHKNTNEIRIKISLR